MLEQPPIDTSEKPKRPYFDQPSSSKEFLAAKNFLEKYVDTGKVTLELVDTPESMQALLEEVTRLGNRLLPGNSPEGVVAELKKAGVISAPEKVKKEKAPEFVKTEYITLEKPKEVEIDEEQLKAIETNLLFEELKKADIFKNADELEAVYQLTETFKENRIESKEYYYEFKDLLKGGMQEVDADIARLEELERSFEAMSQSKDLAVREKQEYAKKVSTITERALVHAITEHKWYGKNVSVEPVSRFDDVIGGFDGMLEIRKQDEETGFLALAIDVTFRGLESEQFKQKFFKLLQSIADGHKTKAKYFKNHEGAPMKKFPVPKMVLYFNTADVKEMVDILKHPDHAGESSQKDNILSQVIQSCDILAAFAEEYQNNIFRRYVATKNSFIEQGWENEEVRRILETKSNTKITQHLKALVEEFKLSHVPISHAA